MEKITLNMINFLSQSKDGKAYINKKGKPFTIVAINYNGTESATMYCDHEWNADKLEKARQLQVGDTFTAIITKNGDFQNWDFPKKSDELEARLDSLEQEIQKIKQIIAKLVK